MPALRYRLNGGGVLITEFPGGRVDVLSKEGEWKPVQWLGFVCEKGAQMLTYSRPGKVRASMVTNGSPGGAQEWRTLSGDEYVLGILCLYHELHDTFGVYAIVDKNGWPIVKGGKKPPLRLVS